MDCTRQIKVRQELQKEFIISYWHCKKLNKTLENCYKKTDINFIPDIENPSPDYYCTWQTQLYATSDGKPAGQRKIINEKSMFSSEYPYAWTSFYEKARRDLFFCDG